MKKFEEYKSNTNEMNITPVSIDAGKRIIRIAENLEKLLNEIDERQENLKSYWKTGGNVRCRRRIRRNKNYNETI